MELASAAYEVLGKNQNNKVRIRFTLSSIPTKVWTESFNHHASTIYSVINTRYLFLEDYFENIDTLKLVGLVQQMISQNNYRLVEDVNKTIIILGGGTIRLKRGICVIHDSLPYDASIIDGRNANRIVNYSQFLTKISNNQIL